MLRRLVRGFYRARYFPRLVVQMHNAVLDAVGGVSAAAAADRARQHADQRRSAARLEDVQAEIASMCDDVTRQALAGRHDLAGLARQLEAVQRTLAQFGTLAAQVEAVQRTLGALGPELQGWRTELERRHDKLERRADVLERLMVQQEAGLRRLEHRVGQQTALALSDRWTPEAAERVRATLSLLRPACVEGVAAVRAGRDRDGGYVMLDDFEGIGAALSLGIADDASWDEAVAARGLMIWQFDPSVAGPPAVNERFRFERLRVAPEDLPGTISLGAAAQKAGDGPLLLKMDIEGAEWDVLAGADEVLLRRFRQILVEFHDLDRLGEERFGARAHLVWAKLARTHLVAHVHGNNCGNFANVGNTVVPQSLEVTFALRDAYQATDGVPVFPTALDRPNEPGRADLFLGAFRFDDP